MILEDYLKHKLRSKFLQISVSLLLWSVTSWTPGRSQLSVNAHYIQAAFQPTVFLKLNVSSKGSILANLSPALVWYWISYNINDFVSCDGEIVSHWNTSWADRWTDALKDGVPFWFSPFLLHISCLRPWMTNWPGRNVLKYHFTFHALGPVYHYKGTWTETVWGGYENDLWTALYSSSVREKPT